jgi:hypothetical protein
MSTNPKELNTKNASEELIAKHKKSVDRSIRNLVQEMEHEKTLLAETPLGAVQRVLKVYRQIKPLLTVISSLPILPLTWRMALNGFTQALDALAGAAPGVTAAFKAGKDL